MTVQDVNDNFPETAGPRLAYDGPGKYVSAWKSVTGPASADFTKLPVQGREAVHESLRQTPTIPPRLQHEYYGYQLIRLTITVRWH